MPSTHVYLHYQTLDSDILNALFRKHAVCGALGLIIEQKQAESAVTCPQANWEPDLLELGLDTTVQYDVSSTYDYKRSHDHCVR